MEYILVHHSQLRPVFVNGERCGTTNALIRLEPGTHTITLGEPHDYLPTRRRPTVRGTTPERPLVVEFGP